MYKKHLIKISFFIGIVFSVIFALNFIVDPYGYKSRDDKYIKNLTMFNKPSVTNSRIQSDGYYYLIGSSRMARVSPQLIESFTGRKTHNIKIDGATFLENLYLASKIKEQGKSFIYSFDVFSLNKSRQEFDEIKNRHYIYKNELEKNIFFSKYFNSDITIRSIQHLIKKSLKEKKDKQYLIENLRNDPFSYDNARSNSGVLNLKQKSNFSNYASYSTDEILKLAKLASKDDIFIILPKYVAYYSLFKENQNISKKYFTVLRVLVENTDAKVWSFYGGNKITRDQLDSNFF